MNNEKIDIPLNLALNISEEELSRSSELRTGYDSQNNEWEVIVRYRGSLKQLEEAIPDLRYIELYGNYGIITLPKEYVDLLASQPEILYIEKPKRLFFATEQAKRASCISNIAKTPISLTGKGVLIGVIDSGIDYSHPDFRNVDGTTRILYLWDQTLSELPYYRAPEGYGFGCEFTMDTINQALEQPSVTLRRQICPSIDTSGHGTHVTGIAAGNGRASDGVYSGVAPESTLIIVKLGNADDRSFPRTTQLMSAIDYIVKKGVALNLPTVINISFGNNYGSHSGTSLLESYIDTVSDYGRTSIVIGSGNEGASAGHTRVQFTANRLGNYEPQFVDFAVGAYEQSFNIQIWKNFADIFSISLIHPSGNVMLLQNTPGTQRFNVEQTTVLAYIGEPSPYSVYQEIYLDFIPQNTYVNDGIWQLAFYPLEIRQGRTDLWLPGSELRGSGTAFLIPYSDTTLTIPSTSAKAITVGAYDSRYNRLVDFSGRGYTWQTNMIAPTLIAPGIDITAPAPNGRYDVKSGTSMATPFVSGSAAILMQEGIVNKRDPYMYGEKLKAYLIRGTRPLPALTTYPNPQAGWGTLCLEQSLAIIKQNI